MKLHKFKVGDKVQIRMAHAGSKRLGTEDIEVGVDYDVTDIVYGKKPQWDMIRIEGHYRYARYFYPAAKPKEEYKGKLGERIAARLEMNEAIGSPDKIDNIIERSVDSLMRARYATFGDKVLDRELVVKNSKESIPIGDQGSVA